MWSTIRTDRRKAFAGYWISSSVILFFLGGVSNAFTLLFAVNAVFSIVHRRQIAKVFLSTTSCYNCGGGIDLDQSTWQCGCGFRRAGGHIFDHCPSCKGECSHLPCPSCQVTLLV